MSALQLKYGLNFSDIYQQQGLVIVDKEFCQWLAKLEPRLHQELTSARATPPEGLAESKLLVALAPWVEIFLADLFNVNQELQTLSASQQELAPLYACKRLFVQRKVAKSFNLQELDEIEQAKNQLQENGVDVNDELSFAKQVMQWLADCAVDKLKAAHIYAGWALFSPQGREKHRQGVLFKLPAKIDVNNLLNLNKAGCGRLFAEDAHLREGFFIQSGQVQAVQALDNANYCIYCHNQQKDSCSHGLRDKTSGEILYNELQVKQAGCPLKEHISEMNYLKSQAHPLAALATAMVNNPLLAATGYRICNDCMKACIYQKQQPVDIPLVESSVLQDILQLPWGFEIYSLLTRWNPLNFHQPFPCGLNSAKVLVVGLGPAGFTLAHYLLQCGYIVTAIDGLKIEQLPAHLSGINAEGRRQEFMPLKDLSQLYNLQDEYRADGFGGVAEYGITVRWNKNYLKIIRLLLERRANFRMYGGVRFGSNITYDDAKQLGFDHISLAVGAGSPNLPATANIMAKGVRTASDFLMNLQLAPVAEIDSVANLQIRLPAVVVGGGLTAVDTAVEILAYYPRQVEKFYQRTLLAGDEFWLKLNEEERQISEEFIVHAKALRKCQTAAEKLQLLRKWGGVTVAYRADLQKAPSYRLNHEELDKAFIEGITMLEDITPQAVEVDQFGSCTALQHVNGKIAARSIFLAIGTKPNTVLAREFPELLSINQQSAFFNFSSEFMVNQHLHPAISCFGDAHPKFAGNVVKAMASAQKGYKEIQQLLQQLAIAAEYGAGAGAEFFAKLDQQLIARVHKVNRLAADIVEVVVHAPLAAANFAPGQFYRLQNFCSSNAKLMEGLALTGAWVDKANGLVAMVVLEMGASSKLCAALQEGEVVCLMGPTGSPTQIPSNKTIVLVGGGLGNAVLFSIGKAARENGCRVLYFAGYKKIEDCFKQEAIEEAADVVVWCCEQGLLAIRRGQDAAFKGNVVEAMLAYARGEVGSNEIKLQQAEHIITIGSDRMMHAVQQARQSQLAAYLKPQHVMVASINSPMQCMMKEICGQCLQRHVDPITGEESYVYSCFNQDQPSEHVDFNCLNQRLQQNSLLEKMADRG